MGKKDRRAEIPDKKARKTAAAAKEEAKEQKDVPKIKGCHVSIDVCGGCIRPKDPIPEANSQDGVKMSCSNHHCPFSITHSVHKECFQKLTDKVVSMLLRTGSSSWTDEQRVENAWRKKGLTFVGKFISCPCGHGTQTLEDSENRWSRVGEVVLDPQTYEKMREEKIKKALSKQDKPVPAQPKALNCSFGGREQAVLERRLQKMEWKKENEFARGDTPPISFPSPGLAKKQKISSSLPFPTPPPSSGPSPPTAKDEEGFTTIGKDGRARESTPSVADAGVIGDRKVAGRPQSILSPSPLQPSMAASRADRGRTVSSGSNTSWLTSSTLPQLKERKRGGKREAARQRNKENRSSTASKKPFPAFSLLSGSEDEEDYEEEELECPNLQSTVRNLREFADEYHIYSGIGLWSPTQVKELNQHLSLFKSDSAIFQCRVTGRKLKDPTLLPQLTPVTAWIFTTQSMAFKKDDIPPGTQLTLQEYYAIFHDHEMKHLDDPIIWCKDGTLAALECVDMTMLTMGM